LISAHASRLNLQLSELSFYIRARDAVAGEIN